MKIGLIDDEPIVLDLIAGFLGELGHDVTRASTGEQFLDDTSRTGADFDLIVTDFKMPGISGTSLIRELHHRFPSVPVVVMSGYAEAFSADDVVAGVHAYLSKPIHLDELEILLEKLARARGAAEETEID